MPKKKESDNIDDINELPLPDFRHFIDKPYNWELEMFENEIKPFKEKSIIILP